MENHGTSWNIIDHHGIENWELNADWCKLILIDPRYLFLFFLSFSLLFSSLLIIKVVSEFLFGHPKCHFWALKDGHFCQKWPSSGIKKMALWMPNESSETTFIISTSPKMMELAFVSSVYHFWKGFWPIFKLGTFWPFYSLKMPTFAKIYVYVNEASESENKNSFEISEQNGTTCRYAQSKKRKKSE